MKRLIFSVFIFSLFLLNQGCTSTRRFGTTIERDEKNPCIVNMVVQIGIAGTDADVAAVKADLESCFGQDCFIPCPGDSTKGCMTKVTIVVKSWGSLNEDEQRAFHYVLMVDNDGLPSTAYIGRPNVAGNEGSCVWRRDAASGTYCHEVLHLCGLYDKYCARIYDPVTDSIKVERNCDPPPDPAAGVCCTPTADHKRCTYHCAGHEDDIMGSAWAGLSCDNILHVLKNEGFDNCPPECCGSDSTFSRPLPETYIIPGYFNFGGKNNGLGHLGIGAGYNYYIKPSLGVTIEGGAYQHSETNDEIKQTSQVIKVSGGITWLPVKNPPNRTGFNFATHLLAGILHHTQKSTVNDQVYKNSATAFCLDIGVALNWRLNRSWSIRMLQVDYVPSFFGEETQHNYRVSVGVVKHFGRR